MTAKDVILARKLGGGGGGTEITDGIVVKARDANGYATEVDFYGTAVQPYQFYCSSRTVGAFKNMKSIAFKNAVTAINAYSFHATGITQLPEISSVSELASNAFRKCTMYFSFHFSYTALSLLTRNAFELEVLIESIISFIK